ncbi:hypothetical protein FKM82_026097 [Ascaphus truei]
MTVRGRGRTGLPAGDRKRITCIRVINEYAVSLTHRLRFKYCNNVPLSHQTSDKNTHTHTHTHTLYVRGCACVAVRVWVRMCISSE